MPSKCFHWFQTFLSHVQLGEKSLFSSTLWRSPHIILRKALFQTPSANLCLVENERKERRTWRKKRNVCPWGYLVSTLAYSRGPKDINTGSVKIFKPMYETPLLDPRLSIQIPRPPWAYFRLCMY